MHCYCSLLLSNQLFRYNFRYSSNVCFLLFFCIYQPKNTCKTYNWRPTTVQNLQKEKEKWRVRWGEFLLIILSNSLKNFVFIHARTKKSKHWSTRRDPWKLSHFPIPILPFLNLKQADELRHYEIERRRHQFQIQVRLFTNLYVKLIILGSSINFAPRIVEPVPG